ncbi:GIY-YIG nuclease family protein, partial [Mesorhizobium japonicum]|uniref:GIY-YIG nuclease family protein n=1 Tax=Mesorhizobium japonicum TaxID=2066070 RepID=UPI003B5A0600
MTSFEIASSAFSRSAVRDWPTGHSRLSNWPVVYVLDGHRRGSNAVYVGETVNASNRMLQHLDSPTKQRLTSVRIVIDPTFNKSVCLDLESYL